ncbi:MAG: hypothetical protein ABTQ32_19130 [Myxococcaceae bacterium]
MNRRELLKLGVVATSAPGCATVLSAAAPVVPESLTALFAKLDEQLLRLDREPLLPSLLGDTPNRDKAQTAPWFQEGDALARKTLKAFLIAGTFQSLTPEQWQQPIATERLLGSMADLDEATLGMTTMLEGLSQNDRKSLGESLRDDPALGMRIMGAIDERAGEYGVSLEGRTRLRAASAQAVSRMRQSPDLVIGEVTGKIRKLEARHGVTEEAHRRLGVSMASLALFQDGAQPAGGGSVPTPPPAPPLDAPADVVVPRSSSPTPPPSPPATATPSTEEELAERKAQADQRRKQTQRTNGILSMTLGGVALGIVVIGAVAGLVSSVSAVTIGVLLGGVGIVALIGGLIAFLTAL